MTEQCWICKKQAEYFIDFPYGETIYLCEPCGLTTNNAISLNDNDMIEKTLLEALDLELGEYHVNKYPKWCHTCRNISSKHCNECTLPQPTHYQESKEEKHEETNQRTKPW